MVAQQALAREAGLQAIEYEGLWYSWGDLNHVATQIGCLLDAGGVADGVPVGFVPRNRPAAVAAELGLIARGQTIRMIYAFQSAAGIARDLHRLPLAAVILMAEDLSPEVLTVIRERGLMAITLEGMNAHIVPGAESSRPQVEFDITSKPSLQILTSGTTGTPKQVSFDYDFVLQHIVGKHVAYAGESDVPLTPRLITFPLGNVSGVYSTLPPLLRGQRVVLLDRFTVPAWHDYVVRHRPASAGCPPVGLQMILDADIPPGDLSSIKSMLTGAAPLDPNVQRAFEDKYGIPVLLSYGATEFGGPITLMTLEDYTRYGRDKLGSVGRPFAGAKLRIVDPDTGLERPPGDEGLLEVQTPRLGSHWIRTSDIAKIDTDGFLWHLGRADGAIMRGGFKLLPDVIEHAIKLHPSVAAVAVVGVRDARLGQTPAAAIEFRAAAPRPTVAELETHIRQHVYATHVPTHWAFVEKLPRTPSYKVDIIGVRQLFANVTVDTAAAT
jgi:acyl-coenzyme A synthetase/AMP-(fatty) acid ligase